MDAVNNYPELSRRLLKIAKWRPSRRDVRICFRSMYFACSPFEQPCPAYYASDPEYIGLSAGEKQRFVESLGEPVGPVSIAIRSHTVILDGTYTINIPSGRFTTLRAMYLATNLANIGHMYLCIAFVYTAYKFCKNYITLMLAKYPYVSRVRVARADEIYYSLYDIDVFFGSRGPFTHRAPIQNATIYMPIAEIASDLHGCTVVRPDKNGTISVELSDGRRTFKIYLSKFEYIPENADFARNTGTGISPCAGNPVAKSPTEISCQSRKSGRKPERVRWCANSAGPKIAERTESSESSESSSIAESAESSESSSIAESGESGESSSIAESGESSSIAESAERAESSSIAESGESGESSSIAASVKI